MCGYFWRQAGLGQPRRGKLREIFRRPAIFLRLPALKDSPIQRK
jgi:hypothetical protein